jgi:hypothetical protein
MENPESKNPLVIDERTYKTAGLNVDRDVVSANIPLVIGDEKVAFLKVFKIKDHPNNPLLHKIYGRLHHPDHEEPLAVTDITIPKDKKIKIDESLVSDPEKDHHEGLKSKTLWALIGGAVVAGVVGIEVTRRVKRGKKRT